MKNVFITIVIIFTFYSCNNSSDNVDLLKKELDLKKRELDLKEREIKQRDKEIKILKELIEKLIRTEDPPNNKPTDSPNNIPGIYPQGSLELLDYSDLYDLKPRELKIMRNEIFARHGFIFETEDMLDYFLSQSWYEPRYTNVNDKLSKIEKQNIDLIKRYE